MHYRLPWLTVDITFWDLWSFSNFLASKFAIPCWLSWVECFAYFLCRLCNTYPPIYCSPYISLSDNSVWDGEYSSEVGCECLQYVRMPSATLVASNVA